MPSLSEYMVRYDHEHTRPWNRVLHSVGIPMIFAGVIVAPLSHWGLGAMLFTGGWALLFLGHRIEGNKPAFFQGPVYFLVGPLWAARELGGALMSRQVRRTASGSPPATPKTH